MSTDNPVKLIQPARHGDSRGWFYEVFSAPKLSQMGINCAFVQENHSLSRRRFTLRGLHFQAPPRGQNKLVRCVRGRIFDGAMDVRRNSPTYGNWVSAELTAENGHQLFIPVGFAHGFLTLEPDCEVVYLCSDTWAPEQEGGVSWRSSGVEWPLSGEEPQLNDRDASMVAVGDFESPFVYDGQPLAPLI